MCVYHPYVCCTNKSQCIARRIPEKCKTFQQQESSSELDPQFQRLERTLETKLDSLQKRFDALQEELRRNRMRSGRVFASRTPSEFSSGNSESFVEIESDDEASETENVDVKLKDLGPLMKPEAMDSAIKSLPGSNQVPGVHTMLPEGATEILNMESFSPVMQDSFTRCLGRKQDVVRVVDIYFKYLNMLRHPIPKHVITEALDGIYENDGKITEKNLTKFALIVAVLALTTIFLYVSYPNLITTLELDSTQFDYDSARRFSNITKIACGAAQNLNCEDQYAIYAYSVLSRHYFVTGSPGRSWAVVVEMVRLSYLLGLHRDGSAFNLDPETCENRRMIWSIVYAAAQNYCLGYGRPPLIIDAMIDTRPPHPVTPIEEVPGSIQHLFKTVDPPNLLTINKIRSHFTKFISVLCFEVHSVVKSFHYSKVMELHTNLKMFVSELPFYFQVDTVNGSLGVSPECDEHFPFLKLQRCHLWFDIAFFFLTLHCPYLLRILAKPSTMKRYAASYNACMKAVKLSLAMRRNLLRDDESGPMPQSNRTTLLGFRWFNTTVVAGILLLLTPPGQDANALRGYMEEFIEVRQRSLRYGREDEAQKDIATIRAFLDYEPNRTQNDESNDAETTSTGSSEKKRKRQRRGTSPKKSDSSEAAEAETANNLSNFTTPNCSGFESASWPSGNFSFDPSTISLPNTSAWSGLQQPNMNMERDALQDSMMSIPTDLPAMTAGVSQPMPANGSTNYAPMLNLGGMFRSLSIFPQNGMSPRTMMPIWPMNAGSMPIASQELQVHSTHQDQDTHELLNLW